MERHLSDDELAGYRSRIAAPKDLIAVSDHLSSCDDCYRRFNVEDRTAATYAFVREYLAGTPETGPDHLLYEQMAGYADGKVDASETEAVKSHIKECSECDADVRDLLRIKQHISEGDAARTTRREAGASAAAGISPARYAVPRRPGRGFGLAPYWQSPGYRLALQAACLVLVILVSVWASTRGLRSEISRLEQEAATLQGSNDELRRQAADAEKLQGQLAELERDNERLRQQGGSGASGVSLKDGGGVIALGAAGDVVGLDGLPARYQELLKGAIGTGKVNVAMIPAASEGRVGTTLGSGEQEKFNVLAPVRSTVESERPVLKWQALRGGSGYVVFIKDTASGEEVESSEIARTEWAPEKALTRGHVYNWMVEAVKEGRRVRAPSLDKPYASFKVLDDGAARELKEAKQKWPRSHLLLGALYARAGVREQAVREFETLQAENPGSPLAKTLLSGAR